jgi:hypothetical protein
MGLLGKMKNYVTGGAAKLSIEIPAVGFIGMPIPVKVKVSAEADFKCEGLFIDVAGSEHVQFRPQGAQADVTAHESTHRQALKVCDGFEMDEGQTREFTTVVVLPRDEQPTYKGKHTKHTWQMQARLEAKGNDPDSGWKEIRIGAMS